jgi:hypothetical protein
MVPNVGKKLALPKSGNYALIFVSNKVASLLGSTRTDVQCLHRWNKVLKPGLHKGTWTKEEDQVVLDMVTFFF